jgi:flavorubredoxin/flavin reductase (DIM6/NTAB) family NADH-FMN oxidoreductase RutF
MHGQWCQRIGLVGRHVHIPFDAHPIQRRLSSLPYVKIIDNGVIKHSNDAPRVVSKCSNREEASAQAVQEVQEQAKEELQLDVSLETLRVSPSVTLLRASCAQRPPEIQFGQALGTTTNCYLVSSTPSPSQTEFTLIDLPSKLYAYDIATWLEELGALQGLTAVMLTRFGPDRIPALKKLLSRLEKSQKITLFASNPAFQLLKDRAASDLELAQLLDGHELSRGVETGPAAGQKCLQLIPIPTPRWPDLCAVYYPEEKILFSSSFFSAHISASHISASHISASQGNASSAFDDEEGGPFWEKYVAAWRFYFDCMMSPTPKQTAAAFEKLRREINGSVNNNRVSIICPLHGPVVRSSLSHLVSEYSNWIQDAVDTTSLASVVVLYASAYGNTAALAQALSRGITKAGVGVEMLNLEVVGVDEVERALDRTGSSGVAGFVIGSPTLGGHMPTQVQSALGAILRMSDARALPCGVFGSYGWSGEAVDEIEKRLKDGGFKFGFPTIRCKFSPTEAMLQLCEESGTDLAQAIKRNMRKREKTVATNLSVSESESVPGGVLALGRVVGTLCVLTAKLGGLNKKMDDEDDDEAPIVSGMLASWVSQASFAPPGLTVAVKKDRAVESMLPVGSRFVLNVLPDSNEGKQIIKSMLKPFSPGEDRFQGLDVVPSEATGGCFILKQAASYLECTVAQRMEAGDHWIVYAIVNGGEVLNDGVDSAVHHRVSGARY